MTTYCISDMHGHYYDMQKLFKKIDTRVPVSLQETFTLYRPFTTPPSLIPSKTKDPKRKTPTDHDSLQIMTPTETQDTPQEKPSMGARRKVPRRASGTTARCEQVAAALSCKQYPQFKTWVDAWQRALPDAFQT